jgi:SagB-type dehydrogenase family enzyme
MRDGRSVFRALRKQRLTPESHGEANGNGAVTDQTADQGRLRGAVYVNAFRPLEPSFKATALRTHALRYDALRDAQHRPAEEFLVNSRLRRNDVEFGASVSGYFTEPSVGVLPFVGREGQRGTARIELPPSTAVRLGLGETIARRRSVRAYTGDPMPFAYLASILRLACGITGYGGDGGEVALRATPSGGGLYPIELHIVALRVTGLSSMTAVYDAKEDVLWQTGGPEAVDAVLAAVAAPDEAIMMSAATAVTLLVARPWRAMRKYGPRAMRHVFLEAGAIAEHVNLAATALGVGCVDSSSFYDDEVHEALGVDGVYETLVHGQVLGIPA